MLHVEQLQELFTDLSAIRAPNNQQLREVKDLQLLQRPLQFERDCSEMVILEQDLFWERNGRDCHLNNPVDLDNGT